MNAEDRIRHSICEIQAETFALSCDMGLDSEKFIEAYMTRPTSADMDRRYDRLHWMGAAYTLEDLETYGKLPEGEVWDPQAMYWMGFLYRFWHFETGLSSREIYKIADARTLAKTWYGMHTVDFPEAVRLLTEAYHARKDAGEAPAP